MSRAPNGTGIMLGNRGYERKAVNVQVNGRTHRRIQECQVLLVQREQRAVSKLETMDRAVACLLEALEREEE